MTTVVPAIPAVTLPDGPYYTRTNVTGECSSCTARAVAYFHCITDSGEGCEWASCAEYLTSVIRLALGTDVTVELDNRWLLLAGAGELPTFARRAS